MSDLTTQQVLKEIQDDLKQVLIFQRELSIHKKEQESINRQVLMDLKELDKRINHHDNNINLLLREDKYTKEIITDIRKNFDKLTIICEKLSNDNTSNKNTVKTHSKIFWTMFSLNISLIVAVLTQVIKNYIG